jgi:formamidopyrimidine-DNA glycosylase
VAGRWRHREGLTVPELPEVEAARRLLVRLAVGRRITAVTCADDPLVFDGASASRVRRALLGRRVLGVHRHGKHLWLALDGRPWPVVHFGMSGGLHLPAAPGVRLVSRGGPAERSWPPRFTKLRLALGEGRELALADARRLGRIRLRHDPEREPPVSRLGFDALRELPPLRRFHELLSSRAAPVKAVLLDQGFAAGVGNWVADEALYQARIAPHRSARSLSTEDAARLRGALRAVLTTAVRVNADSDRYPRGWLFHRRWRRDPAAVTARGERLRFDTIAGRTTAWVPAVQRPG